MLLLFLSCEGRFTGSVYVIGFMCEGTFIPNDKSDFLSYEGSIQGGKMQGQGIFHWPNGDIYEGDFVLGKRHGMGVYTWPCGAAYVGEWADGHRNGKGKQTWADGSVFHDGFWKNSSRVQHLFGRKPYLFRW